MCVGQPYNGRGHEEDRRRSGVDQQAAHATEKVISEVGAGSSEVACSQTSRGQTTSISPNMKMQERDVEQGNTSGDASNDQS